MSGTFERGGVKLGFAAIGDSGPTFLFQHGLCGDRRQTAEVAPDPARYRTVTLECRGHGASELGPAGAISLATFADDLAAFIETELDAPVILGGISMGAVLALRLAVRRPDLVRGLVLVRPAWVTAAAPDNMVANLVVGDLLGSMPRDAARQAFLETSLAARLRDEAPDNLASLVGFFDRPDQAATAILLTAISRDGPDVTEDEVRHLALPTLVIGHERDVVHPLTHAKRLSELIAQSRLAVITPKATDRAAYVAELRAAIEDFLEELDR